MSLIETTPLKKSPSKKFRRWAIPAAAAGALALSAVGAMPASAAVTNPAEGSSVTSGSNVTVNGTALAGAQFFAISSCNVDLPAGTACNAGAGTATSLAPVVNGAVSGSVKVTQTFDNFDYSKHRPSGGSTTCVNTAEDNGGSQCAVVVSYYAKDAAGKFTHLGEDVVKIYVD